MRKNSRACPYAERKGCKRLRRWEKGKKRDDEDGEEMNKNEDEANLVLYKLKWNWVYLSIKSSTLQSKLCAYSVNACSSQNS